MSIFKKVIAGLVAVVITIFVVIIAFAKFIKRRAKNPNTTFYDSFRDTSAVWEDAFK